MLVGPPEGLPRVHDDEIDKAFGEDGIEFIGSVPWPGKVGP